jgi:uncharacterized Zn-binding protein involved in type VI secretion
MGFPVARLGDTGTHGGAIITAASKTKCEGQMVARVADIYNCPIHGPNPIKSGSPQWITEGHLTARTSSTTACGATIIGGATKTFCD